MTAGKSACVVADAAIPWLRPASSTCASSSNRPSCAPASDFAELVVTNHGKLPVWLPGAGCSAQLWVRDDRGNAAGQYVACSASIPNDWLESGETGRFRREWRSGDTGSGQYFAVGYVVVPRGSILFSDTVAISVEPASP